MRELAIIPSLVSLCLVCLKNSNEAAMGRLERVRAKLEMRRVLIMA